MSIWKAKECEQSSSSLCLWYRVFLRQMFKSEDWRRKKRSISWNHCLPDWGVWQWLWTWVWVNRQTINKKIQKDQNLKNKMLGAKARYCTCTLLQHHEEWADHLSLQPNPWTHLYPIVGNILPQLREQAREYLVFDPYFSSRSPSKALPEFLAWPLINFYWLWGQAPWLVAFHCYTS